MTTTPRKVFLSYAREDGEPFARDLSARLAAAGHEPWRDEEQLRARAGNRWMPELTRQLLTADVVVAILTPGACQSRYVEGECLKAMKYSLPVVPAVFLECGIPLSLESLQLIDFRPDLQAGLAALIARLEGLGVATERDLRTLEALRAMRTRATGDLAAELDTLIKDAAEQIKSHPADIRAQSDRVERGLVEERARAAREAARPTGPGVRRAGRRPLSALDAFRDRVEQRVEIATALVDPKIRMVSVLGRGGMGKTALACFVLAQLEAAAEARRGNGPWLHGVAYLEHTPTHPITLDRVLADVARVLPDDARARAERVFGNRDLSIEDRVDRFLDLVPDPLVVVLLDNFEDGLDERGHIKDADLNLFIRRVLAGPGALRLLVTARAAITLPASELRAERQIVVRDGLPEDDAIALLREFDPNDVLGLRQAGEATLRNLVKLTHGIPRALELVANILQGDDDGTFVLDIDDMRHDFYTRETVVRKLVEVNYAKLRPDARRVLEAVAVYGRPVPPVAIDFLLQPHVLGLRLGEVMQLLVSARLVSIERGDGKPGTIGLHPIDRDFLYQRLPLDGTYSRATLQTRAAEFYVTQRTHGPTGWCDLRDLLPQLFEFEHLVQAGAYDQAVILLGEYASSIAHCGHPTHCRDLFLKLPDRFTSDAARVSYALTGLIWKAYLGPVAEGLKLGEDALRMALAMNDLRLELRVREQLVYAYRYAHDGPHSLGHAERIIERIAEAEEPLATELTATHQIALDLTLAYTYSGDVARAAPIARRAYDVAVAGGEPQALATALNGLAVLYFVWGRYSDVVQVGRDIERVWRPGFHDGIAYCKNLLGMSQYLLGDYAAAVTSLIDAAATADEWDSPRPEALARWNLSLIHALHGVYDKAQTTGREAEVLMTRLGLDRAAHAPRMSAEAASVNDHAGFVQALLLAADESTSCGDLFPGAVLAERAGQIARRHQLLELVEAAETRRDQFVARLQLPEAGA